MANITLRDFVNQCQLYEHSTEHYDLMKECSELVLLEQYIDNQLFLMENAELMESSDMVFEDGYFQESAGENSIDAIMEKADDKKKNIFGRIWDAFKKLVQRFANFLLKCSGADTTKDLKEDIEKLESALKENEEARAKAAEEIARLQDKLNITVSDLNSEKTKRRHTKERLDAAIANGKRQAAERQELKDEVKRQQDQNLRLGQEVTSKQEMYDMLNNQLLLCKKELSGMRVRQRKMDKTVDPNVLTDILAQYIDALNHNDRGALVGIEKRLDAAVNDAQQNGVIINFTDRDMEVLKKNLENALNKANERKGNARYDGDSAFYVSANNMFTKINECVGATCNTISKALTYRKELPQIVKALNKSIDTLRKKV